MSRSSARRGQVEPLAAIVAVFAVGVGLALYATSLAATVPSEADRTLAEPTLVRVSDEVVENGVVRPGDVGRVLGIRDEGYHWLAPDGYRMCVVLTAGTETWTYGPEPPESTRTASRRVGVELAPGRVRPGRLRVVLWQ